MLTVISGTDRPGSKTKKVADLVTHFLKQKSLDTQLIDLGELPKGLFQPKHYKEPPRSFQKYQDAILHCNGILTVVPEYNGSFPGAMKYFIDLLRFPESLKDMPCGFIGLASGSFGAIRAIEHLEMIFQYRGAHLFGLRSLFIHVDKKLNEEATRITDKFTKDLFEEMLSGYIDFAYKVKPLGGGRESK